MSARLCTGRDYRPGARRKPCAQGWRPKQTRNAFARVIREVLNEAVAAADHRYATIGKPMARSAISSTVFASMAVTTSLARDAEAKCGASPNRAAPHLLRRLPKIRDLWHASLRRAQPWPLRSGDWSTTTGCRRRLLIEIHRILVDHANAAGGLARTNRPGLIGAMDAKYVSWFLAKDTWRGRERIGGPPCMPSPLCSATIDFLSPAGGPPFPWAIPVRPFLLALDRRVAIPNEPSRPTPTP